MNFAEMPVPAPAAIGLAFLQGLMEALDDLLWCRGFLTCPWVRHKQRWFGAKRFHAEGFTLKRADNGKSGLMGDLYLLGRVAMDR